IQPAEGALERYMQFGAKESMIGGVLAAIGASLCCVVPLVLLGLGIGGAWIANLTALEPYRPVFIGVTVLFVALAYRGLYATAPACAPDEACADPAVLSRQRIVFWVFVVLLAALLAVPWLAPLFY